MLNDLKILLVQSAKFAIDFVYYSLNRVTVKISWSNTLTTETDI